MQELESTMKLQAVMKKDKEELDALKIVQETEAQIAATKQQIEQMQRDTDRKLQSIENHKSRTMTQASDDSRTAGQKSSTTAPSYVTMSSWIEALSQLASGATDLKNFRQQLLSASESTITLDTIPQTTRIGAKLLMYAKGKDATNGVKPTASRGLNLVKEGNWFEALNYFAAAEQSDDVQAWLALSRAKLGLPPQQQQQAQRLINVPMSSTAGPGTSNGQTDHGQQHQHPAQHLADAINFVAQAQTAKGKDLGSLSQSRTLHARAVSAALAWLLHPSTPGLPKNLWDEALNVLSGSTALVADFRTHAASDASAGPLEPSNRQQSAWEARAAKTPTFKKALDLIGLGPVKQALSQLADQVDLDNERGLPINQKQYNACFYGSPGTGKTTVARIYAELLKELKVIPAAQVVETSGAKMVDGGVNELKKQLQTLDKGGVLFVDEAYQLNPKTNPMGAQVLDALLPEMENRRGRLVVVFAGYQKQMEGLMSHNEGLPSRFPLTFTFPDYEDAELHSILKTIMKAEPRFKLQDGRIAAARLGRQRGTVGFGNARAVRNCYERMLERQATRVLSERAAGMDPDKWLITREDILGPKFLDVSKSSTLKELRDMRGLPRIKEQVENLLSLIRINSEAEEQGKPLKEVCLNRVFVGKLGTGKTTVAGIYGRILKDLGLLSKGEVIVKNPSDFTGGVLGESEQKTVAILDAAVGSVLVIDEAYSLFSGTGTKDPYKEAIIDTIVAKVQGVPGDDRCVLLLGYEDQMEAMMRGANPGLARRFQWQGRWHFDDYGPEDLLYIMRLAAKKRYGWNLGEAELLAGVKALEGERRKPNFGNAGAVNNLLSAVAERMEMRLKHLPAAERAQVTPTPDDLLPPKRAVTSDKVFEDLVGCRCAQTGMSMLLASHFTW